MDSVSQTESFTPLQLAAGEAVIELIRIRKRADFWRDLAVASLHGLAASQRSIRRQTKIIGRLRGELRGLRGSSSARRAA